jgi:hypothetical protein
MTGCGRTVRGDQQRANGAKDKNNFFFKLGFELRAYLEPLCQPFLDGFFFFFFEIESSKLFAQAGFET